MSGNNRAVENKIRRLTREISEIDGFFYFTEKELDRDLYAAMLERKRDDIVRSAVLQLHTAIEDLLSSWIERVVLDIKPGGGGKGTRSNSAKAIRRLLWGGESIGFSKKLTFAVALGIINVSTQKKLIELNRLRNKCSHNWLLKVPVRRGKHPKQKKPPLLLFKGRDLHGVKVMEDFSKEYGLLYSKLFSRRYG